MKQQTISILPILQKILTVKWNKSTESIIVIDFNKEQTIQCQTRINNSQELIQTEVSFQILNYISNSIKKGFPLSKISKQIFAKAELSTDFKKLQERDNKILGGGGCGSASYRQTNEGTVVKNEINKAQIRNKRSGQSIVKADVQQLNQDMEKLININDNDVHNGKAFIIDQVFPLIDKFGVVANRVLHKNLQKILMKSVNIILKVGSQSSDGGEQGQNEEDAEDAEDLVWTEKDKKYIDDVLTNILDRIKAKQNSEYLINQIYCITMIRNVLRLHKHSYKMMDEAIRYGVPLFGLIRNQDPTLLLMLAVKALEQLALQATKNQTQEMVQFQIKVMDNVRKLPEQIKSQSKNTQLLFSYHNTLDEVMIKKSSSWEVQYFAFMQINELIKVMIDQEEVIQTDNNQYWNNFFKDKEKGIFTLCKKKFSMSDFFLTDLMDSYLLNHKMLRSIALEILLNCYKLIIVSDKKAKQNQNVNLKSEIINLFYQRWLFENSQQVRTLFVDEDVLTGIDELISKKKNEQKQQNGQAGTNNQQTDEDIQLIEYAKEESQVLNKIKQQRQQKQGNSGEDEKELEKELNSINDTLECITSEDGIKKIIRIRQIELWKQSILNRRAKGEVQKDDSLLESINLYVNQRLQQKLLQNSDEENQEQQTPKEFDALDFIKNQFILKKSEIIQKKNDQSTLQPMLVVVANGGMGKSMLLKKIEMDLLEDFSKEASKIVYERIPIIVKMLDLDPLEPNLIEYLQNQPIFKEQRLDAEVLKNSALQKVILFDAFDEFKGKPFNLWSTLNLQDWQNTKVIVTCREESLQKEDYNQYFSVSLSGEKKKSSKNNQNFELYKLIQFGKEQLLEFAKKSFNQNANQPNSNNNVVSDGLDSAQILQKFQQIIEENDQILKLISIPINAYIFIKTLPLLLKNNQSISIRNQTQLQEIFFNYQFERESLMLPKASTDQQLRDLYKTQFFILFQNIAIDMFKKGSLSTDVVNVPFSLLPQIKSKLSTKEQNNLVVSFKQHRNPQIICTAEEDFQDSDLIKFTHKSLFEYFVARAMKYDIDASPNSLQEVPIEQFENFAINSRYIMDRGKGQSGISILQQLARMIKEQVMSTEFQQKCETEESLQSHHKYIQVILLSRRQHHGEKVDIASSNMLSAIAYLKPSLNKLKLTRISAKKAYLYNFRGKIDLTGSNLREGMLNESGVDYSRSRTNLAQINDAQSLWCSKGLYSFQACVISTNQKNPKCLNLIVGSQGGYFNEFQVDINGELKKDQDEKYIIPNKKSYELKRSKQLYGGNIIAIKQFENKYIVAQQNNIIVLDENGEEIQLFQAHSDDIVSIDINYQLKHLATVSKGRVIKIWNISKQFSLISALDDAHNQNICNIAFSQTLGYLASGSLDKKIKIWKYQGTEYTLLHTKEVNKGVKCITFTHDGKQILSVLDFLNEHPIWKVDDDKIEEVQKIKCMLPFCRNIIYSPNGKYLIATNQSQNIFLFDVQNQYQQLEPLRYHDKWVINVSFSNDSKYFVSTGDDNSCVLWDIEKNFKPLASINSHKEKVMCLSYSSDGQYLVSSSNSYFYIWKVNQQPNNNINYDLLSIQSVQNNYVIRQIDFTTKNQNDKYQFAVATKNETFLIYEFKKIDNSNLDITLIKSNQAEDNTQIPLSLQYSHDDQLLLSTTAKQCNLYSLNSDYQILKSFDSSDKQITSACFISDIKRDFHLLIIAFNNNVADIWDISERRSIEKYKNITAGGPIIHVKGSQSGKYLATATSVKICQIWDASKDFTLLATLNGVKEQILNMRFSYDSQFLACTFEDKSIKIWSSSSNFESIQTISTTDSAIEKVDCISFNPLNSQMLLSSFDENLILWDTEKAFEIDENIQGHTSVVTAVCFSQEAEYLITAGRDSLLKLWHCSTISNPNQMPLYELINTVNLKSLKKFEINKIAFSSDNNNFITSCTDGAVRVYKIHQLSIVNESVIQVQEKDVNGLCLYPTSNNYLAIACEEGCIIYSANKNNQTKFQNMQVFKKLSESNAFRSVEFSSNQKYLATGNSEGTIILWDSQQNNGADPSFNLLHKFTNQDDPYYVNNLRFTPDCQYLVVGFFYKLCQVINIEQKTVVQIIKNFTESISCLDISSDGNILSISNFNNQFFIYKKNQKISQQSDNQEVFQQQHKIQDHSNRIYSVGFSKKGNFLATGSMDKTCRIWSLTDKNDTIQIKNIQNL